MSLLIGKKARVSKTDSLLNRITHFTYLGHNVGLTALIYIWDERLLGLLIIQYLNHKWRELQGLLIIMDCKMNQPQLVMAPAQIVE